MLPLPFLQPAGEGGEGRAVSGHWWPLATAAIGGAILAEWLATGKGLGNVLVVSFSASDFNTLWSGAVLIVAVSVGLYGLVGIIEKLVLARMTG